MNRRLLAPILLVLAVIALAYGIYRSTADTITVQEGSQQVVYGQPQHGLTLGLCIFAGLCVLGAVIALLDDRYRPGRTDHQHTSSTTSTAGSRVATNYPH